VFVILRNQQFVAALGPTGLRMLLLCLLMTIDVLLQVVDSHYVSYHRVLKL
jgi:hypothetical protein